MTPYTPFVTKRSLSVYKQSWVCVYQILGKMDEKRKPNRAHADTPRYRLFGCSAAYTPLDTFPVPIVD